MSYTWVWLPTPVFLGFPGGSDGEESTGNAEDLDLTPQVSSVQLLSRVQLFVTSWTAACPGLGRSPGGGHGNPLQYCCLENPHVQRSLVGYSPWGCKELDMTE